MCSYVCVRVHLCTHVCKQICIKEAWSSEAPRVPLTNRPSGPGLPPKTKGRNSSFVSPSFYSYLFICLRLSLSEHPRAAATNYHKLSGSKQQTRPLLALEAAIPKGRPPPGRAPSWGFRGGLWLPLPAPSRSAPPWLMALTLQSWPPCAHGFHPVSGVCHLSFSLASGVHPGPR